MGALIAIVVLIVGGAVVVYASGAIIVGAADILKSLYKASAPVKLAGATKLPQSA